MIKKLLFNFAVKIINLMICYRTKNVYILVLLFSINQKNLNIIVYIGAVLTIAFCVLFFFFERVLLVNRKIDYITDFGQIKLKLDEVMIEKGI